MNLEEWVAPIPGRPCLTGLLNVCKNISTPISEKESSPNPNPSLPPYERYVLCNRKLSQVESNHLRLDLNLVEFFSGVDTDDGSDHLWDDDHITKVGLNEVRLLVGLCLLLSFAELFNEAHRLALQTAVKPSTGAGMDEITEFF